MPHLRLPFLCLTLLALAAFTGCGDDDRDAAVGGGSTTAAGGTKPVIAVVIPPPTHGWTSGVQWSARRAMEAHEDEVDWKFQTGDAQQQSDAVRALLQQGLDALVILPDDSERPLNAVKAAREQGVEVITVDRGLSEPVSDLYVAGDNAEFGRVGAKLVADRVGRGGKVVVLRGKTGVEIDKIRYEAGRKVLDEAGVEVLAVQNADWNKAKAYEVMQNFLTKYPEIDAVWASDDDMALGVADAVREAGREGELFIIGGAGMQRVIDEVAGGSELFPADVTYPPGMIEAAIHLAAGRATGATPEAVVAEIPAYLGLDEAQVEQAMRAKAGGEQTLVTIPVRVVTRENAGEFKLEGSPF